MTQSSNHPITPLSCKPDWKGVPHEGRALYLRVLTHLTRQSAEAGAAMPSRLAEARDLGRAICLAQHCWHGQFPCMVCRSWIGPRLTAQLETKALCEGEKSKG